MEYQQIVAHVQHLQNIAARMHESSRSAKNFNLVIVGAILTFGASTYKPNIILVAVIPTILFALLDAYYLRLERDIINCQNKFLDGSDEQKMTSFLKLDLDSSLPYKLKSFLGSLASFSIWPYYLGMLISIGIVYWFTPLTPPSAG